MTKPILLLATIIAVFEVAHAFLGYGLAYRIGYGTFAVLAAVISATFCWLWYQRSTPLALGMAFGWAGASSVMAWWWLYRIFSRPDWMLGNSVLFVFLSVYLAGAILHLEVIGRSFSLSKVTTYAPVAGAVLISVVVAIYA